MTMMMMINKDDDELIVESTMLKDVRNQLESNLMQDTNYNDGVTCRCMRLSLTEALPKVSLVNQRRRTMTTSNNNKKNKNSEEEQMELISMDDRFGTLAPKAMSKVIYHRVDTSAQSAHFTLSMNTDPCHWTLMFTITGTSISVNNKEHWSKWNSFLCTMDFARTPVSKLCRK